MSSTTSLSPAQSKEAALHGQKALTPILSGSISGGIIAISWTIGLVVWLYKRHRRARRAKAAGFRHYREFVDPPKTDDAFIIPPDPALLAGQARPGQKFLIEDDDDGGDGGDDQDGSSWRKTFSRLKHAKTVPDVEQARPASHHADKEGVPPGMDHRASAPCRMQDPEAERSTTVESDEVDISREGGKLP